jgi:hypothetical protein
MEITKAIQKLKQIIHEKSLRKNFIVKELDKDLFIKRYSI